jgi:hypothetical protein
VDVLSIDLRKDSSSGLLVLPYPSLVSRLEIDMKASSIAEHAYHGTILPIQRNI